MRRSKTLIALILTALAVGGVAQPAGARMKSSKLEPGLCLTVGGGRFVDIPGFPGEMIDRRLLRDVRWLRRHYSIFVTDGYSTSGIHSPNGEHPLGLALDIVPDRSRGGSWADIDALAAFAEPSQNDPVSPFRWVGYDGDANHGRGHHLHLSWSHSPSKFATPAESVYTMRCPKRKRAKRDGADEREPRPKPSVPDGGTEAGKPPYSGPSGGVTARLAPVVQERDGAAG